MKSSELIEQIIRGSTHQEELVESLLLVKSLSRKHGLVFSEQQELIFVNHVNEMIKRVEEEALVEGLDLALFKEISEEALTISRKIIQKIGDLPIDEVYLLAVHFENAKKL